MNKQELHTQIEVLKSKAEQLAEEHQNRSSTESLAETMVFGTRIQLLLSELSRLQKVFQELDNE